MTKYDENITKYYENLSKTFANLSEDEKNKISHRAMAMKELFSNLNF